jgi:Family of unknown function (DUF6544)
MVVGSTGDGDGRLYRRLLREVAEAGLPSGPGMGSAVTEEDLDGRPEAVKQYLRFMGVVGRPRDWSFRARFVGRFRLKGRGWMPAEAWQYNSALEITRIYVMRLRVAGVVPMTGVDAYLRGRGRMRGKLLGFVPVVEGKGEEFDVGELVTWLNDAVLLAPSFLLTPAVSWSEVNDRTLDVTLTDRGRSVAARVFLDERGAPRDFSTTDRYADLPSGLVRAEWTTPVSRWGLVHGRPFPGPASAIWHTPDGPLPYVEGRFVPGSVAYNIAP